MEDEIDFLFLSVINHNRRPNMIRRLVTHLAVAPCVTFFCFYHILTSSVLISEQTHVNKESIKFC